MDNDASTCSVRSNSAKVSKIFDQFMASITPAISKENKENTSHILNTDQRSNYHMRTNNATPDRTTRNSSQLQAMQALQKRNQELKTENDNLRRQMQEIVNHQNTQEEIHQLYAQLQSKYQQLDDENQEMVSKLHNYQQEVTNFKTQKEQQTDQIINAYKQQIEDFKLQYSLQGERFKNVEGSRGDQERILMETLEELKKERQLTYKTKQEFRLEIEQIEQQHDKQMQYQQKLYQELKQQQSKSQNELNEQIISQEQQINSLKLENQKVTKNYNDIKQFYEQQMKLIENDVTTALSEQRQKVSDYHEQCDQLEAIIEDLQDKVQQSQQQLFDKDKILQTQQNQLEYYKQQQKDLKSINEELVRQLNEQLQQLSQQIEFEKNNSHRSETTVNDEPIESDRITEQCPNDNDIYQKSMNNSSEYKMLLQQIIEVEKEAFRLNSQYQSLFAQFSKSGQLDEGCRQQVKEDMTQLMTQIKRNNQQLYELKGKEFTYLC